MKRFILNNEEQIKKWVDTVKDKQTILNIYGQSIEEMQKIIDNPVNSISPLDKDYSYRINVARNITILAMAIAIKTEIFPENYKDIIVEIQVGNLDEPKLYKTQGDHRIKNGKSVSSLYLNALVDLASGDISLFLDALGVFAHELFHAKQYFNSQRKELSISNLIYSLEHIAYYDDYKENYNNIFYETEAFYNGYLFAIEFMRHILSKNSYSKENSLIYKNRLISIAMKNRPNWQSNLFDFETQCNYVKKLLNIIEQKNITISPQILNKYPILKIVFDNNGILYEKTKIVNFLSKQLSNNKFEESEQKLFNLLIDVFNDNRIKKK